MLARYRMPLAAHLDQATGLPVRKPRPVRYEATRPGERVHIDIEKLGRILDGGGHYMLGRVNGNRHNKKRGQGYASLHHAIDSYSRLVYSSSTPTNGKVERFNRTLASEWAYDRLYSTDQALSATSGLVASLQPPPTPHRDRRAHARRPRSQPHWELQIGTGGGAVFPLRHQSSWRRSDHRPKCTKARSSSCSARRANECSARMRAEIAFNSASSGKSESWSAFNSGTISDTFP